MRARFVVQFDFLYFRFCFSLSDRCLLDAATLPPNKSTLYCYIALFHLDVFM